MNSAIITVLVVWGVLATCAATWAIFQLTIERSVSRMVEHFRENDRKFYRGWEQIWFAQLHKMAEQSQPKSPPTVKRAKPKSKAKRRTQ